MAVSLQGEERGIYSAALRHACSADLACSSPTPSIRVLSPHEMAHHLRPADDLLRTKVHAPQTAGTCAGLFRCAPCLLHGMQDAFASQLLSRRKNFSLGKRTDKTDETGFVSFVGVFVAWNTFLSH